jgi:uncharacterized protein (DUF1697 family)
VTSVALLRGINVGRAKRVAMADLRRLAEELGYGGVRTLLNSGNLVFDAGRERPARSAERLARALADGLGVSSVVTALSAAELATVVEENALAKRASDPARLLVAFCPDGARLKQLRGLLREDWSPEALAVGHLAAYAWCPTGILASRLLQAVGRVLGETATTRNWATVRRIHAALGTGKDA